MKTTLLNISKMSLLLFLGLGTILISCSGEDGKDGINGEVGPAGQDGNANVIVSDWMLIEWHEVNQLVPPTLGSMLIDEITGVDDVTAFMETGGIVLFYLKRDLGVGYISVLLPYEENNSRIYANVAISTDPNYDLAGLVINGESSDVTQFENNENYMIRYLLVPANVVQTTGMAENMPKTFHEAASLLGF